MNTGLLGHSDSCPPVHWLVISIPFFPFGSLARPSPAAPGDEGLSAVKPSHTCEAD